MAGDLPLRYSHPNFILLFQFLTILHSCGGPNAVRPRGNQTVPAPESGLPLCLTLFQPDKSSLTFITRVNDLLASFAACGVSISPGLSAPIGEDLAVEIAVKAEMFPKHYQRKLHSNLRVSWHVKLLFIKGSPCSKQCFSCCMKFNQFEFRYKIQPQLCSVHPHFTTERVAKNGTPALQRAP